MSRYIVFSPRTMRARSRALRQHREEKSIDCSPGDATASKRDAGISSSKKILRHKVGRLCRLATLQRTYRAVTIFSARGRNYAAAAAAASPCARDAGAIMLEKLFSGGTASLRSDIRLPKLTPTCTCPRYETPRSFSYSPSASPPPKDNERMRRAENEIRGVEGVRPARRKTRCDANARFAKVPKNYVALVRQRRVFVPTGLCNELKGAEVTLRVRFYE